MITTVHHRQSSHAANLFVDYGGKQDVSGEWNPQLMENLHRDEHGCYAPFHVHRSPTVDSVLHLFPGERRIKPVGRLTRWDNIDVPGEQDRFTTAAPFLPAAENWAAGEVSALLCPRFAWIFFQQRIRIRFPQLCGEAARC